MLSKLKNRFDSYVSSMQPLNSPKLLNCFVYLLIPVILALVVFPNTIFQIKIDMLYIKFFICLLGVTFAYKDLSPYIKNVTNFKTTLVVSFKLILVLSLFTLITLPFTGSDPQDVQRYALSDTMFFQLILELPFTAIGEEIFKALMLFAFIRLFKPFKNMNVVLAIILSSIVFGLLHINYNFQNSLEIILAIGITCVPTYIFLLYYKSIYPLILIHFVQDFVAFSSTSLNYSFIAVYYQLFIIIMCMVMVITGKFGFRPNKN